LPLFAAIDYKIDYKLAKDGTIIQPPLNTSALEKSFEMFLQLEASLVCSDLECGEPEGDSKRAANIGASPFLRKIVSSDSEQESSEMYDCSDPECGEPECEQERDAKRGARRRKYCYESESEAELSISKKLDLT